jgi:hypothetical protein
MPLSKVFVMYSVLSIFKGLREVLRNCLSTCGSDLSQLRSSPFSIHHFPFSILHSPHETFYFMLIGNFASSF